MSSLAAERPYPNWIDRYFHNVMVIRGRKPSPIIVGVSLADKISSVDKIEEALTKVQEFLSAALVDGWCPYSFSPGQSASTEATAWAIIALSSSSKFSVKPALEFLIANQKSDGGWATGPGLGKCDWTSGPATLALRLALHVLQPQLISPRIIEQSLNKAFNYLLNLRTEFLPPVGRLLLLFLKGPNGLQYSRGWPWNIDCYNWVEPTSYCLMALKLPTLTNVELGVTAISHANKYLLEHVCKRRWLEPWLLCQSGHLLSTQ